MTKLIYWGLATFCILAASTASADAGQLFDVTNVGASDVLNMRSIEPGTENISNAEIVGKIPYDAKGVEATGRMLEVNQAVWREVSFAGKSGWVHSQFLTRSSDPVDLADEDTLSCSGTEPFWSYEVKGKTAMLSDPGADSDKPVELNVKVKLPGIGRRGLWFVYAESENKTQGISAVINQSGQCSDGMSDYLFDLEIFLMGFIPGEGPVQGCCTIQAK